MENYYIFHSLYSCCICRDVATCEGGGGGCGLLPLLQFPKSSSFSVNIRDIAFYVCSEIIWIRSFTIFTVSPIIFGQFTAVFQFFQLHRGNRSLHIEYFEKIRYLTLDLLKCFLLWTIQKNTTMNESLNVSIHINGPQLNTKGSILEYLEIFSKVTVGSKCGPH